MAQQTINNGDAGLDARTKINTNFLELYTGKVGTATAQTNVTWTVNSLGISLNAGGYLTTARASNDAIGLNTAQTNVTWTVNSAGLSLNAGGYAGTGTGLNLTNLTGTFSGNTAGFSLSLSAAAPGAGGGIAAAAGTQTQTSGTVLFQNSNNITFGMSDSSVITASFNPINIGMSTNGNTAGTTGTFDGANLQYIFVGSNNITLSQSSNGSSVSLSIVGDGPQTFSTFEPFEIVGRSTVLVGVPTATSAGVSIYPFHLEEHVSAGIMNMAYSMSFLTVGTSSGRQTMGIAMGIYTLNVSTLSSLTSTSFSIGVTGNNSSYTINHPTSTDYTGFAAADTNSAGSNISSGYTGMKLVGWPVNTLLTPGNYYLALLGTNSTSSVNVGISMSHMGAAMGTFGSALAPIGSYSSSWTSGFNPRGGRWNIFQGSWSSVGSLTMIPASMAHNSISAVGLTYPAMKFWRT